MIDSGEPEICVKMLRHLTEKVRAKLPKIIRGYSMVKCSLCDGVFSECFELEASPVKVNHCSQEIRKGEIRKAQMKEKQKPRKVGHFVV